MMGLRCSWLAVEGVGRAELLQCLNLVETGREADTGCGRFGDMCFNERANGWIVVFCEDFDWSSRERVAAVSSLGLSMGCQFEDKVEMACVAFAAKDGKELWRVFHKNDPPGRLDVSGNPPSVYYSIRDHWAREQEEKGGADYFWEIPVELAKAVCGYRMDEEDTPFQEVKPVVLHGVSKPSSNQGFWSRLLGR
jgi:hypothetical protein